MSILIATAFTALVTTAPLVPPVESVTPAPTVRRPMRNERPTLDVARGSTFKCQDGGELTARFDSEGTKQVAIVDTGKRTHTLPLRPWNAGEGPNVTWSDGRRTLIWSPGVQLRYSEGSAQRGCSRDGSHEH